MAWATIDNSYARLPERLFTRLSPMRFPAAKPIAFNEGLASELGLESTASDLLTDLLKTGKIPEGFDPLAQVYAGHQFGGFSPQLGDGRALLLGEVLAPDGKRFDIQLKGSGRTPYSRNGDGRAGIGPVLREYLLSEFMHAVGIPSTRALAAFSTGDHIYRETALPGAVLVRVAASHIRVGTFEFFASRGDIDGVRALFEHVRARHYPDCETPFEMLQAVMLRQTKLVASWMGLGFIHGVMNTDNTSLSGETIDYGPAAFMETFHRDTVYSSIDQFGRYAYSNQARIIVWNLAQLASALLLLEPSPDAVLKTWQQSIDDFSGVIEKARLHAFGRKIGLSSPNSTDLPMIDDLLSLMQEGQADFTNTFRALATDEAARDQFLDPAAFDAWAERWKARIANEPDPRSIMQQANPQQIPRNHLVEEALQAGARGDYSVFNRLLEAVTMPFDPRPEFAWARVPAMPENAVQRTFCGT